MYVETERTLDVVALSPVAKIFMFPCRYRKGMTGLLSICDSEEAQRKWNYEVWGSRRLLLSASGVLKRENCRPGAITHHFKAKGASPKTFSVAFQHLVVYSQRAN